MKNSTVKPLALAMMLLATTPAWAEKTWKLNLKDADISALVNEMAEITGRNFVVDPRVKGTVTVVSSRAMSADELYELFQSVLSINGFATVSNGPVVKILPDTNARQAGVRVDSGGRGEQLVTRVIVLRQANANELMAALRPMMPQFAHMAAVPGANALIISDRAGNAQALEAIIRELDNGDPDDAIEIIPVRNGRAADLLGVLETMEAGAPAAGAKEARGSGRVRIVVDERSNRLLVRGDRALRDRVRAVIRSLDEAPEASADNVKVFRLKYANARQVAEVLKGVLVSGDDKVSTNTAAGSSSVNVSSNADGSAGSSNTRDPGTTTITVGNASLIADESQNALIVRARPAQIRQVEAVLAELDTRRSQVLIQAAIVEVSGDNAAQLGVQWASGDPANGVGIINFNNAGASLVNLATAAVTGDPSQAGIGQGAAIAIGSSKKDRNGDRTFYGALIQALESVADANLLSTPSIMTLDNQEAKIVVGQNVPFITGTTGTQGSGLSNPFTTIERQDVGITLKVTPSLSEGGTVRLDVEQEVSSVVPSADSIRSSDLITNKRSIKTTILADDGQTIVLGGLVQDDVKKSVSKVPLLGDIPGLGVLFRATSDTRIKRNLLVFLQPTILRDAAQANALTARQYESVRRIDLGVDAEGRFTRLPERISDIYQGGVQRDGRADLQPSTRAPQASSTSATTVVVREQPAARPAPAAQPASASLAEDVPVTYAVQPVEPIVAESLPVSEPVRSESRSVPAPTRTSSARSSAGTPAYVPSTVAADPAARPFSPTAPEAPSPYYFPPAQPVQRNTAPVTQPAAAAPAPASGQASASASTTTSSGSDRPGMRKITTSSGNVYYVPENPPR